MKIAMVCPEFPPNGIGGGAEVYRALSEHLPRAGVRVDVIAANYRGGAEHHRNGVAYHEIPLLPTPAATPYLRTVLPPTPSGLRSLRRLLAGGAYDAAHLHGVSHLTIDIAAHALAKADVPWVFTMHGQPRTPYRTRGLGARAYDWYLSGYGSFVMRRAAVRTSVSAATREFHSIAPFMHDARVIPNGVDCAAFAAECDEQAITDWPDGRIVLSIGRISYAKGFDIGIRGLAAMNDPEVRYVVLGEDGGELSRLRELARTLGVDARFLSLGSVNRAQLLFALRRADVVWVPSRWEAFGIVPLEAMACGVPVLTSGTEGLRETFAGLDEFVLHDPDDASELAGKTRAILDDARRDDRLAHRLREHARRFDWTAICAEYVKCYRDAISR